MKKGRLYFFINIAGLSVGLACVMLLGLYIRHEISYDTFHEHAQRISLFTQWDDTAGSGSGFASILSANISQIESVVRIMPVRSLVGLGNNVYYEDNFCFADSTIFHVFSLQVTEGDPATAMRAQYGVLLSRSMVHKYFPDQQPIGKTIKYDNNTDLVVMGIFEDLPATSHLTIDFICSSQHAEELLGENLQSFWDGRSLTYVLFANGNVDASIRERLPDVVKKTGDPNAGIWKLSFIPLHDIYLKHNLSGKVKSRAALQDVYVLSAIAFFILLLAAFNFINLSTARSGLRGREVGIRKTLGAQPITLVTQFMGESAFYILVSVCLAFVIVLVMRPEFSNLTETKLDLASANISTFLILAAAIGILTLLTGAYPSFVLSAFKPIEVLKSVVVKTPGGIFFRKLLVVSQFTVSVVMIVSTLIVMQQISFIQHKDLGYQMDQILALDFPDVISDEQRQTFKNEVTRSTRVASVSLCSSLPGKGSGRDKLVAAFVSADAEGSGIDHVRADADFIKTFGIKLKAGKDFSHASPDNPVFLVNERALKYFGWDDPIGQTIGYYTYQYSAGAGYREVPIVGRVIGVIDDYHQHDLRTTIQPLMISYDTEGLSTMSVKLSAGHITDALVDVEKTWKRIFPHIPFTYQFLDDAFDSTYRKETRTARVFGIFATLAIVISCLGLFGLSSFIAQQRYKEIGIRKVFGASSLHLATWLSRDYIKLVILANVIAFPLAWMAMQRWLTSFSYHVDLGAAVFISGGLISIAIALLTVSSQTWKASNLNPVKTLKND